MSVISTKREKVETLLQQFKALKKQPLWLAEAIKDIEERYKALHFDSMTYREKQRVIQKCNTCLREFHHVCYWAYLAEHGTKSAPLFLMWEKGKGADFYEGIIKGLQKLDATFLYIVSRMLKKSLSSYEEDIAMLRRLDTKKTSNKDYKELLNIAAALEGLKRIV